MKHLFAALFGAVASAIASYCISLIGALMGWMYFSEGSWLIQVSLIPCVVAALTISFCAPHTRRATRLTALSVSIFTVALAGSVGAIAIESAHSGFARVNISGYFVWCWFYALVFLPLSYALSRGLQRVIQRLQCDPECRTIRGRQTTPAS